MGPQWTLKIAQRNIFYRSIWIECRLYVKRNNETFCFHFAVPRWQWRIRVGEGQSFKDVVSVPGVVECPRPTKIAGTVRLKIRLPSCIVFPHEFALPHLNKWSKLRNERDVDVWRYTDVLVCDQQRKCTSLAERVTSHSRFRRAVGLTDLYHQTSRRWRTSMNVTKDFRIRSGVRCC